MQDVLPNKVPDTSNFRHDWNKLIEVMRRSQLQTTSDILVSQNAHGTTLMVSDRIKQKLGGGGIKNKGTYNETGSYSVDDLVYVDFNKTYTVPFTVASGSAFPALVAGTFLCVNNVPTSASRNSRNYYYPIYPLIPSSSVVTVSGSLANQTFWQPITPLLPMTTCINNVTQNVWVAAYASGSFIPSQLPYH